MDIKELENRFAYHTPSSEGIKDAHQFIREECLTFAKAINNLVPEGREKSLAITHLEEVMFWANAAIARSQKVGN